MSDVREVALETLCVCAKSRGRHSVHCPTVTARHHFDEAIRVVYGRLLDRIAAVERERDEARPWRERGGRADVTGRPL